MDTAKTKPQHTQGEWHQRALTEMPKEKTNQIFISDKEGIGETIAFCEKEVNAKRIVKCVNMHDALVKGIETALSELELTRTFGSLPKEIKNLAELLKQAAQE